MENPTQHMCTIDAKLNLAHHSALKQVHTSNCAQLKPQNLIQFTKNNLLILSDQEPRIAAQFLEYVVCILSDQLAIADKRLQGS